MAQNELHFPYFTYTHGLKNKFYFAETCTKLKVAFSENETFSKMRTKCPISVMTVTAKITIIIYNGFK